MRILITGGRGQLGLALQKALAQHRLFALGHSELDVTDAIAIRSAFAELRPELVIHAAAWTDTAGCEEDPQRALLVNGEGTRLVAEACREADIPLLYVSTNEVFDGCKGQPYTEADEPNPLNAYARSKLAGEQHVKTILERYYIVRTAWLYGPGRISFPEKILQMAQRDGHLRLVTDEVASPTWTVDLAGAIARLIEEPAWGVYHLTNSGCCSRLEWAREVLRLEGLGELPIEPTNQREYGAPYRKPPFSALANVEAARLGIVLRPWQEALRDHLLRGIKSGPGVPAVPGVPSSSDPKGDAVSTVVPTAVETEAAQGESEEMTPTAADISPEVQPGPTPAAKRFLDVVGAGLVLAILWPIWALALALIKLDSPGPVMLRQKRVGLGGREFTFYKFRTMLHGPQNDLAERIPQGDLTRRLLSPRRRHPNVTPFGWALRKTTVDELPQLLNVIKGDMSLVGPRPDIPEIVASWPRYFHQRHKVRPGLTGLAQVNGRSDLTHYQKLRYDLEYVRSHPISRDLAILLKTIGLVLSKKGAR